MALINKRQVSTGRDGFCRAPPFYSYQNSRKKKTLLSLLRKLRFWVSQNCCGYMFHLSLAQSTASLNEAPDVFVKGLSNGRPGESRISVGLTKCALIYLDSNEMLFC